MAQGWQVAIGMAVLITAVLVGIDRVQAITDRQQQTQARVVQTEAAATNTSARQQAARETAQVDRAATFAAIQATATALTFEISLDGQREVPAADGHPGRAGRGNGNSNGGNRQTLERRPLPLDELVDVSRGLDVGRADPLGQPAQLSRDVSR